MHGRVLVYTCVWTKNIRPEIGEGFGQYSVVMDKTNAVSGSWWPFIYALHCDNIIPV